MTGGVEIPFRVLSEYGFANLDVSPAAGGLINDTFVISRDGEPFAVLQRLHPVFAGEVNVDLDAVTAHLASRGLSTPRLIRTRAGARWVQDDRPWRAISYVPGRSFDRVESSAQAESAGELVGRFHRALDDFDHEYAFVRAGVHDTEAHLHKLTTLRAAHSDPEADSLADEILGLAASLPSWGELARRHSHGDLKLSNVRFARGGLQAVCLIDLDTCGRQVIAYELGDALRSWCNPAGEDTTAPQIDLAVLESAMRGYARGAQGLLAQEEIDAIVPGLQTVCVELAARFASDVYEDCYFGWDSERFGSRREHNLVRSRGQLALASSAIEAGPRACDLVRRGFEAQGV